MTRRIVAFTDKATGITYKTPEFNGDRAEQLQFMGGSTCRSNWDEIFQAFDGVNTLDGFKEASERAQMHWHPFYLMDTNQSAPDNAPKLMDVDVHPVEKYVVAGVNITRDSLGKCIELRY